LDLIEHAKIEKRIASARDIESISKTLGQGLQLESLKPFRCRAEIVLAIEAYWYNQPHHWENAMASIYNV